MAAFALGICLMFSGCKMVKNLKALTEIGKTEPAETESTAEPEDQTVSFEAYIKEGETFTFSFEPADVASYEELRNAEFREMLSLDNWDQYFEVKELYWEHMGMMDNGEYAEKAVRKISAYYQNGIYPGEALILTFENFLLSRKIMLKFRPLLSSFVLYLVNKHHLKLEYQLSF